MSTTTIPEQLRQELDEVRSLTDQIRDHQRAIEEIADSRRTHILTLRAGRITYREIAGAMGVTEQSVYKCLKPSIEAAKAEQAAQEETPVS